MGRQTAPELERGVDPATDRCDRCNAGAKLRIVLAGGGGLLFCGHHANKFAPDLLKVAVEVFSAPDFEWRGLELQQQGR